MARGALDRMAASEYLGVSLRTFDHLVKKQEIRRVRIGKKPVFRVIDLDDYLESKLEPLPAGKGEKGGRRASVRT